MSALPSDAMQQRASTFMLKQQLALRGDELVKFQQQQLKLQQRCVRTSAIRPPHGNES